MKRKYQTISELVALLRADREELDARINTLQTPPSSFEEELLLKYIETRSTIKAAEFAKRKGVKSTKGTVFAASDVSSLVRNGSNSVNPIILRIAREIFEKNSENVFRAYG